MSDKRPISIHFGPQLVRLPLTVIIAFLVAVAPAMALAHVHAASTYVAARSEVYPGPRAYQPAMDAVAPYIDGPLGHGDQLGGAYISAPGAPDALSLMWPNAKQDVVMECYPSIGGIKLKGDGSAMAGQHGSGLANMGEEAPIVCLIQRSLQLDETLSDVAMLAGYPLQTILDLNPQYADLPDLVQEGALLVVPVILQSSASFDKHTAMGMEYGYPKAPNGHTLQCAAGVGNTEVCVIVYTVQPGDYLTGIAAAYGITIQELVQFNPEYLQPLTGTASEYAAILSGDMIRLNDRFGVSNALAIGARLLIPQAQQAPNDGIIQPTSAPAAASNARGEPTVPQSFALQLKRISPSIDGQPATANLLTEGATVEYSYEVTNVGELPVTELQVDNTRLTLVCEQTDLDVDATTTCTGADTVSAEDVANGHIDHSFRASALAGEALEESQSDDFEFDLTPSESGLEESEPPATDSGEQPVESATQELNSGDEPAGNGAEEAPATGDNS